MNSELKFETFSSSFDSWDSLFQKACDFANLIGRENVLNISHSCDANNNGVVTVWYWQEAKTEQSFEINKVNFGL